ncbi:hypothetical protein Q3G72_021876 [Acer saccharum]|nr:hypothetical protein Q3G72_021876 [Acer saccharum]
MHQQRPNSKFTQSHIIGKLRKLRAKYRKQARTKSGINDGGSIQFWGLKLWGYGFGSSVVVFWGLWLLGLVLLLLMNDLGMVYAMISIGVLGFLVCNSCVLLCKKEKKLDVRPKDF